MSQINLDLKDRKILYQLDLNARQPNGQIAKKVGLSKEVVSYRIKRLEKEGAIENYYTIIDMSRLGYFSFRIYIKLSDATPDIEKEIINCLVKDKNSFFVAEVDGPFDIAIGVWVKDIYEFEDFYLKFKKEYKKNIGKEQISIFTIAYHFHRSYILEKKQAESRVEYFGKSKLEKHDELDIEILRLISQDARTPIVKMSQQLNVPERTIAFRIKQLEKKGVIQGYRALFNLGLLGYEYYKVDMVLRDISRIRDLISYANTDPNIIYIDQTIGGSDFEFDLEVKNKNHFLEIIGYLRTRFPEIKEWSYITLRKYDKLIYFPDKE
ncbi:MAG: Lrp/AsnC family transcriptional regulator [Nanoarchaeota archaeon]|nr:Lrp/AsnC family transcriptional regulator [Nanoarchaeota archaeon]MBU0977907.1 Lrp/AsnC family transcriptional regulator [Nanoarchaeota archaeon]